MSTNTDRSELAIATNFIVDVAAASILDEYVYGRGLFWGPVYPYHRTPRRCPFYVEAYYVHAGFADHRARCDDGPNPGANPPGARRGK